MAITQGPLLSLGARGQLGKTLVASTWKGIKTMRQYVVPANPQTAGQVAQRNLFSAAVDFWRTSITAAASKTAWNLNAALLSTPMSGFNSFMRSGLDASVIDAASSFAILLEDATAGNLNANMFNIDDGGLGDEAGNFDLYAGTSADDLSLADTAAIGAGVIAFDVTTFAGDPAYYQVRKDGINRSGIQLLTVTA